DGDSRSHGHQRLRQEYSRLIYNGTSKVQSDQRRYSLRFRKHTEARSRRKGPERIIPSLSIPLRGPRGFPSHLPQNSIQRRKTRRKEGRHWTGNAFCASVEKASEREDG